MGEQSGGGRGSSPEQLDRELAFIKRKSLQGGNKKIGESVDEEENIQRHSWLLKIYCF
jgi:hypothetical protein